MAQITNAEQLLKQGWTQSKVDQFNSSLTALQQFRSYSYHHILIAANTSQAADALFSSSSGTTDSRSSIDRFLHPSFSEKYKAVPVSKDNADAGSYVVLINGMTDADFLIEAIEWEAIFVPDAGESNPHGSFVEGTMEIMEPMGVQFLNILKNACDTLKTDPSGLSFILKTIFVGYTDGIDGDPVVKQVIDVNPFTFTMLDIQGEFTNVGSNYTIQFVGQCNGIGRMPAFGVIQQSGLTPSGTIGSALQALEKKLNDASKKAFDELIGQLDESNNTSTTKTVDQLKPKGRMVQYRIIVDEVFKDMALDNVNGRLAQTNTDSNLAQPQGIDIESGITDIMLCSSALVKRLNEAIEKGYKQVFKIESGLDSNLDQVTVVINVKDCKVPVAVKDNRNKEGKIIDPNTDGRAVIEFEYIYTGQNIEVTEYEMKMALGMAFFQLYGTTNVLGGSFNSGSGNIESLASGPGTTLNDRSSMIRELTPIPMSAQVQDPNSKNKPAAADTANFRMFMARWAFVETVSTKIKIAGVPKLLDGFNLTLKDVTDNPQSQAESMPLVKIHVKMPTDNQDDFRKGDAAYAQDFWYDGNYNILSVKNIFRDGRFEQELNLNAIPYEELVQPGADGSGSSTGGGGNPNSSNAPSKPQGNSTTPQKPPAVTPEQKAKHGDLPPTLPPDVQLNCETMLQQTYKSVGDCKKVRLTQSFTLDQFIRRDINVTNDAHILQNICKVANELEKVKAWFGVPLIITSGYRSPAFNAQTKGSSKTSDHMKGLAVDVQFIGIKPQDAWERLKSSPFKFRQCIWEHFGNSSWVHMAFDVDPTYPKQNTPTFFTLPH